MSSNPQFKAGNVSIFNRRMSADEFRQIDSISIMGLYFSETLLFLGVILILFNNLNIIAPGSYFGAYNWVTVSVFSIGLCINFISIPFLYFSSLKNFVRERDFWDKETFWILPLFFFGTFFLYNSLIAAAVILLVLSISTIIFIHIVFIFKAKRIYMGNAEGLLSDRGQYLVTLKYLSIYYVLLLALLISFDPLQQAFIWIRLHV